jgi:hypothetical protein
MLDHLTDHEKSADARELRRLLDEARALIPDWSLLNWLAVLAQQQVETWPIAGDRKKAAKAIKEAGELAARIEAAQADGGLTG